MRVTYTVVLIPEAKGGYVVEVPALPGCSTYGQSLTEALIRAEDAIGGYLAVLQEDGDPVPREGKGVTVSLGGKREAILRKVSVAVPAEAPGVRLIPDLEISGQPPVVPVVRGGEVRATG